MEVYLHLLTHKKQSIAEIPNIIFVTKKNATAPTKIAAGIEAAARVVKAKAKILVIIAPTVLAIKQLLIQWQLSSLLQKNWKAINNRDKTPKTKVIISKTGILTTSPAKKVAATPAPASKPAKIVKMQQQTLFSLLIIKVPPSI